jgi:hypothetical protein
MTTNWSVTYRKQTQLSGEKLYEIACDAVKRNYTRQGSHDLSNDGWSSAGVRFIFCNLLVFVMCKLILLTMHELKMHDFFIGGPSSANMPLTPAFNISMLNVSIHELRVKTYVTNCWGGSHFGKEKGKHDEERYKNWRSCQKTGN